MKWHYAALLVALTAISAALALYYTFNGDIEWYGWFTITLSTITISYTAAFFFNKREEKRRDRECRRDRIRKSIREAEDVFRRMSSLSHDYDFMDENEASEKIAAHARRNAERLGRCRTEIEAQVRHLGARDATIRDVHGVVDVLLWFDGFYGCRGPEPSVAQRVAWNDDRHQIDGRLDQLSEASRLLA